MQNLNVRKIIIFFILFNFLSVNLKNLYEEDIVLSLELETQFLSTDSEPGNQGHYDQTIALKWIKQNIKAIDGNPNNIKLFEEGAGSMAVSNIITSDFSKNLFNKAQGDCSSYVTSGSVTYKGCKESVSTESLGNPPSVRSDIHIFKGMRFAEPPLGDLRFAKPVPKIYLENISIDATVYGDSCMQPPIDSDVLPISEDCLTINVWTPTLNSSANLPVMFWIHGGAFIVFAGRMYNGSQLALRDCVVVTFNYRLGVFGFLYGNRSDAPGNVGLWDQALALKWTIANIQAFGGDPNQITVFGESAGSMSISYLIISNQTRNLFQRAILQSGTGYQKMFNRDPEFAYEAARRFALNPLLFPLKPCINEKKMIECLKEKEATLLLLAQLTSIAFNPSAPFYSALVLQFNPMFGDFGKFMPISIPEAVREGNFNNDMNILIGHNEMEGAFFARLIGLVLRLSLRYEPKYCPTSPVISWLSPFITRGIASDDINYYFLNGSIGPTPGQKYTENFTDYDVLFKGEKSRLRGSAVHAMGDFLTTCPTVLYGYYIAKFQLAAKNVFQYRLTYAHSKSPCHGSCWANVTHGDDIELVFGRPFYDSGLNADDKNISAKMMDIWTTFAKTDAVPSVNRKNWPPYIASPGLTNLSYVELHPSPTRFGRIFSDRYNGVNDGFTPNIINNCLYFWDDILYGQY